MPSNSAAQRQIPKTNSATANQISRKERVEYSKELIESIEKMANAQGYTVLAKLLQVAAQEAEAILKSDA